MKRIVNEGFVIYLEKDPESNAVHFHVSEIVGSYANGEPLEEKTAFHGHFGYDLCIHLRMGKVDGQYYHHFCRGKDIAALGELFEIARKQLEEGLIPEFEPLIWRET